jgi:hypothetical protein
MAITVIIISLLVLALFFYVGFKGTKESKNKPPEVK